MEERLYIWVLFLLEKFLSSLKRIAIFLEYLIHKYVTRGNITETPEKFQHYYLT
jgi:hypothetical protein